MGQLESDPILSYEVQDGVTKPSLYSLRSYVAGPLLLVDTSNKEPSGARTLKQKRATVKKSKKVKKSRNNKIIVKNKISNSASVTQDMNANKLVTELTSLMLRPDRPFRVPRPTGALVHACNLKNEILLTPVDASSSLEGVIRVSQTLENHIEIWSPSATTTFSGAIYQNVDFTDYVNFEVDSWLSLASQFENGGKAVFTSTLLPMSGSGYVGWDQTNNRPVENKVYAIPATISAPGAPRTLTFAAIDRHGIVNPGGGLARLLDLQFLDGELVIGSTTDVTLVEGTSTYTTSAYSAGTYVALVFALTGSNTVKVNWDLRDVAGTFTGIIEYKIPLAVSPSYTALIETSRKYCISAFDALLSFEGGNTRAGHVSCALLPEGENLPHDAGLAIETIAKLPQARKYEGQVYKGAHVSWMPDSINQLWLRTLATEIPSQNIWFAFKCPPAGVSQMASLRLYTAANLEAENYSQIYSPIASSNAGFLMEAVVNTYGSMNPCGENPDHMKKIAGIARKVANDPYVQNFAKIAWKAVKTAAPVVASLIL